MFDFNIPQFLKPIFSTTIDAASSFRLLLDSLLSPKRSSDSISLVFAQTIKNIMIGRNFRKPQLLLLFCQYSDSKNSKICLQYNTACASLIQFYHKLIVTEKFRLLNRTKNRGLNLSDSISIESQLLHVL